MVYQQDGKSERFVARAHATGLETETMSYREAQAIAGRLRKYGKAITNESMLLEVRDRDAVVEQLRRQKRRKQTSGRAKPVAASSEPATKISGKDKPDETASADKVVAGVVNEADEVIVVKEVVVHDYEEWKRDYGKWW